MNWVTTWHLHNKEFSNENPYTPIKDLIHSIFSQYHVDAHITVRFSEDTKGRYMYSEELAEIILEIYHQLQVEEEEEEPNDKESTQ